MEKVVWNWIVWDWVDVRGVYLLVFGILFDDVLVCGFFICLVGVWFVCVVGFFDCCIDCRGLLDSLLCGKIFCNWFWWWRLVGVGCLDCFFCLKVWVVLRLDDCCGKGLWKMF